jgi:hypothetical protein
VPVHEALLAEIYQVQSAIGQMTLVLFRTRRRAECLRLRERCGDVAFEKAVRRKPLAGAADAGRYGNSIDFYLKNLARRGLWPKRYY